MTGLLSTAETSSMPMEEIRFGVILNGGVSLAVWMGGAVLELDQLTKSGRPETAPALEPRKAGVYAALLALAGSTARADVIAGTSAGGINGAALALCQVNPESRLGLLRDVWVDQGRIEALMRQPFRGSPTSLLQGDEFFLPQLNNALGLLAKPGGLWRAPTVAPIDLSITTTVLHGNQLVSVDSMGQPLLQSIHGARFHWERLPTTPAARDPFDVGAIERTAHRLALAARSTASFPVAFEPSFVPVHSPLHPEPTGDAVLTESQRLRPDMAGVVKDWGDEGQLRDRSRFAVDGGLLANTPTRPALKAVEAMPASGPVRRVMLLVYPHAQAPGPDPADEQAKPPTVAGAVGGILGALTAQGSRTFVDELEEHNKLAAGRRGTRGDVLRSAGVAGTDPSEEVETLAAALYPHYCRLRRWRAGRDLARLAVERPLDGSGPATALPAGWSYERVRRAAENAQDEWHGRWDRPSPYYPDLVPRLGEPEPAQGWRWGVTAGLGVAEAGADLLRRLVWVTKGEDYDAVVRARTTISTLTGRLRDARELTDAVWDEPLPASLQPNESYWSMRLAYYERLMSAPVDDRRLGTMIDRVASNEAVVRAGAVGAEDSQERRSAVAATKATLTDQLTGLLIRDAAAPASAGDIVRGHVVGVVTALGPVLRVLERHCAAQVGVVPARGDAADLHRWRDVLVPGGVPLGPDALLTRLLQIEIAATTLGDEVTTGATLPVEVAQLSAQTANAFAQYTRTGDDKLGGMSVNRFGGFLKRSWRVNDWTWGRVDAASHLCRVVLQPSRVRRTAQLTGYLPVVEESAVDAAVQELVAAGRVAADADADDLRLARARAARAVAAPLAGGAARHTVTEIAHRLFPEDLRDDPRIVDLQRRAVLELTPVLDPTVPAEDLAAALPALADLFAWALHLEIVPSELPALAGAVRADGVEGANARSYGEIFVKEHELLLARLDSHVRGESAGLSPMDRAAALEAFDRAGVGREPLQQEGTSDQMIRTATTAAAVAATVVDSEQSGFTAAKPVTRTLRGAMLLPFWVVTGLTGKGVLGRSFSLLALAIGAVLLALALFGALPAGLSGPAAALGASAVLAAFAIGALRSGTMIHGLVLLTPVVPLVAFAVNRAWGDDTADAGTAAAAGWGVSTLLVVVALAGALMVLGSLPATTGSVWAALDRLADRQGIRPVEGGTGARRGFAQGLRRVHGLAESVLGLALWIGAAVGVVALVLWLSDEGWDAAVDLVTDAGWWLAVGAVLAVVVGAVVSFVLGRQLQVLSQQRTATGDVWGFQALSHPAGAAAGWAVLYGAAYLAIAAFLFTRDDWLENDWVRALVATAVVLGVLLVLVVPVWLPVRAMTEITDREVHHAMAVGTVPTLPPEQRTPADPEVAARQAAAWDMVSRGVGYRGFVRPPDTTRPRPELRAPLGTRLHTRIQTERTRLEQERERVEVRERVRLEEERRRVQAERRARAEAAAKERAQSDRAV
jgi:patatin-related protein